MDCISASSMTTVDITAQCGEDWFLPSVINHTIVVILLTGRQGLTLIANGRCKIASMSCKPIQMGGWGQQQTMCPLTKSENRLQSFWGSRQCIQLNEDYIIYKMNYIWQNHDTNLTLGCTGPMLHYHCLPAHGTWSQLHRYYPSWPTLSMAVRQPGLSVAASSETNKKCKTCDHGNKKHNLTCETPKL